MTRWLIYALGGGAGHLVRGLSLGRAARRVGIEARILTNSPFATSLPIAAEIAGEATIIDASWNREQVAKRVRTELARADFDVLVVDTFPRGLAGELLDAKIDVKKVLVHRDINPDYVEQCHLMEASEWYDLILLPGERGPLSGCAHTVTTDPWLIRDVQELLAPRQARDRLGLDGFDERPLIAVMGSGLENEVDEASRWTARLAEALRPSAHVHSMSLARPDVQWPTMELLPGVSVVVGAGGYNTVNEARATGTPLVAVARPRLYDRQSLRLSSEETVEPARLVEGVLNAIDRGRAAVFDYENGTHAAVAAISTL